MINSWCNPRSLHLWRFGLRALTVGLAPDCKGARKRREYISIPPKATVEEDAAESFYQPRQVNLSKQTLVVLDFDSPPHAMRLAEASVVE